MKTRKTQGFTLVEIMVAIFLSTIVLTAVYGVWIRVQREITKSNARQSLQNELRTAANYMQKDLKSIKEGSFEAPAGQPADGSSLQLLFERFKETADGKIAQDSTEKIEYRLSDGLLTRKTSTELKILSVNIESLQIAKTVDAAGLGATDLESTDADFKAGREAKLDISITGRKNIAGSREEMYYVEKTSVVMRDEYYKKTNKNYVSNFDLAKIEKDELVVTDSSQDASFGPGGVMTEEQLQSLNLDQLNGMEKTQKDLIEQSEDSIKEMNKAINDTDTGESGWTKFWEGAKFLSTSEGEKVRGLRSELEKANTQKDIIDIIGKPAADGKPAVVGKLEAYTLDKEKEFLGRSVPGYSSMSDAQKDIYKEAYEMKLQDRTLEGSQKILAEQAKKDGKPAPEVPEKIIDIATKVQDTTYQDAEGKTITVAGGSGSGRSSEDLRKAYDSIDLAWMGEFNKEPDDVGIYNAAKSMISQGKAKLNVVEMRDTSTENVALIQKVKSTK